MKRYEFHYNHRLGIELPTFYTDWEHLTEEEQLTVIYKWERVRSQIPDRIKELEHMIQLREKQLQVEDQFATFCQLSSEISDLASRIIDLNLWFRTQEEVAQTKIHS